MVFMFLSPRSGRAHVNVVSKTGQAMTRNLFMLEEPWVLDLAKQHGLRDVVEEQRERKRLADCREKEFKGISQIMCLVSVSPGKLGHGILTDWTTDWTAEEEYYRKALFRLFLYALTRSLHFASQFPAIRRKGFIQI